MTPIIKAEPQPPLTPVKAEPQVHSLVLSLSAVWPPVYHVPRRACELINLTFSLFPTVAEEMRLAVTVRTTRAGPATTLAPVRGTSVGLPPAARAPASPAPGALRHSAIPARLRPTQSYLENTTLNPGSQIHRATSDMILCTQMPRIGKFLNTPSRLNGCKGIGDGGDGEWLVNGDRVSSGSNDNVLKLDTVIFRQLCEY